MAKVTIERAKDGKPVRVSEKLGRALVKGGRYRNAALRAESPKPRAKQSTAPSYAEMEYRELHRLVRERELETDGRKAEDFVAALEKSDRSGRYGRRDMQAED